MANINDKFFADLSAGATWAAGVAFQRSNPLPLDKYSVFASIAEAEAYATTNAVAYPGQIIAVVNDGVMEVYVLAEKANEVAEGEEQTYSLALQEMGGKIEVDPNTLSTNSLGLLEILGFENAANLTLPQKKDGKVQWLPISEIAKGDGNDNTTYTFSLGADGKSIDIVTYENGVAVKGEDDNVVVQNIALTVYTKDETDAAIKVEADRAKEAEEALDDKITELTTTVGNNKTAAEEALATKADKTSVFTKEETTQAISDAVKGILGEDVSEAYDTLVEIQKLMEADDTASAELVGKVNANEEAIEKLNGADNVEGSVAKSIKDAIANENLSQYAKEEDVANTYATKTELGDYAKSSEVADTYATKTELGDYAKSTDVANTYVTKTEANAENGLRFINQSEIDKLKALNLEGNEITISGSVNASQVKELYDTVVNIVKGSTTDLNPDTPDSVETGLHIEEGAQVNKIEKVIFNGAEATIEGKTATIAGEFYNKTEVEAKVKVASDAASAANTLAESAKNAADANALTISSTNEKVAEHTGKLSTIDQTLTQHGSDISVLQGTVNTHVNDIAQLKVDVQSANATANANNTKIGELVAADETINAELVRLENAKANASSVYTKEQTVEEITKVTGTPADGKTLVQMIEDSVYDDEEVRGLISANAEAISKLDETYATDDELTAAVESLEEQIGNITVPVTDVTADDKVITVTKEGTVYKVSSTLGLKYTKATETENAKIELTGINNEVLGTIDASDFIKDGMLESVSHDTDANTITFTWNTDGGKEATTIDIDDLVEVYTAGNGIDITDYVISAKVDANSETFLKVGANGIKLEGVQAAIDSAKGEAIEKAEEVEETLGDRIDSLDSAAIKEVKVDNVVLTATAGSVNIPLATTTAGLVKSSTAENKVKVDADGTMEVNSLNVNRLVQTEGEYLIINGGSALDA
jgi:hypothetical protein